MKIEQQNDAELLSAQAKHREIYIEKQVGDIPNLICYVKPGKDPLTRWKIALPKSMLESFIRWYHIVIGHPGNTRLPLSL